MVIIRTDKQNYIDLASLIASTVEPQIWDEVYIEWSDTIYNREEWNTLTPDGLVIVEQTAYTTQWRWIAISSWGGSCTFVPFDFTATEWQTIFTLANTPSDPNWVILFLNNQSLDINDEFSVAWADITYLDTLDYVIEDGDKLHGYYLDCTGGWWGGWVSDWSFYSFSELTSKPTLTPVSPVQTPTTPINWDVVEIVYDDYIVKYRYNWATWNTLTEYPKLTEPQIAEYRIK